MRVLYYARHSAPRSVELACRAEHVPELEKLLRKSDFVSVHVPGGKETAGLINAAQLRLMKSSAYLINTARGDVVNEQALVDALRERVIAGAGLDVYSNEPEVSEALLGVENVVLLPHLGSATVETRCAMGRRVLANLHDYFSGREPRDLVT